MPQANTVSRGFRTASETQQFGFNVPLRIKRKTVSADTIGVADCISRDRTL